MTIIRPIIEPVVGPVATRRGGGIASLLALLLTEEGQRIEDENDAPIQKEPSNA